MIITNKVNQLKWLFTNLSQELKQQFALGTILDIYIEGAFENTSYNSNEDIITNVYVRDALKEGYCLDYYVSMWSMVDGCRRDYCKT